MRASRLLRQQRIRRLEHLLPRRDVGCDSGLAHAPQYSANVTIRKDNEGSHTKGSVVVQNLQQWTVIHPNANSKSQITRPAMMP